MTSNLNPQTKDRIERLVGAAPVVLFMKGDRAQPKCGFSAQVVQILDRLVRDYHTVDVLQDPELRDGIKEFSEWPTIPQLYVQGEFQGGCDIVREMYANGELHRALGQAEPSPGAVSLEVSKEAAQLLKEARSQYGGDDIHLSIDARFQHALAFGPPSPDGVVVETAGLRFFLDPDSAVRAQGLKISVRETAEGSGLVLDNPNAPEQEEEDGSETIRNGVRQLSAERLETMRRTGEGHVLVDVRPASERAAASIEGARFLVDERDAIEALPKDTALVFHCHHGGRSQKAAEQFAARGFINVFSLVGGIAAWSRDVDPGVPTY